MATTGVPAAAAAIPATSLDSDLPILAICYGQQTMAQQLGGRVAPSDQKEFGRAYIEITGDSVPPRTACFSCTTFSSSFTRASSSAR